MKKILQVLVPVVLFACLPAVVLATPAGWPKKLTFGLIPVEGSSHITDRFDSLAKHLEKKLGIPVELKTATDYAGVIAAMQFKHIDLAYFGPQSYVEAAQRANAEAFVMEVGEHGKAGYYGMIITKKGSGINSMEDAKGKVFAFTDPNSTSGTLVPTIYFVKDLKIDPEKYFSRVIYSGSHQASILSIKTGRIDVAATNDIDLDRGDGKQWNQEKDFHVLWTSKLIPGSPMAYRRDLPESLKKALRDAFLSYNDEEGLKKLRIKGYTASNDAIYDPIRDQIEVRKLLGKK